MSYHDNYNVIQKFFEQTKQISVTIPIRESPLEHSPLLTLLRPYQLETVQWMVMRELYDHEIQLSFGEKIKLPLGGVLADEMGLGKTVEVLACILGNRKPIGIEKENDAVETRTDELHASVESPSDTEADLEVSSVEADETDVEEYVTPSNASHKRRYSQSLEIAKFCDRPRLASLKINRTLKKKIKELLKEYYEKFLKYYKKKHSGEQKDFNLLDITFKIILLNRFYDVVSHSYSKQQTWGFMLTEFNVDDEESLGYSILKKEIVKKKVKRRRRIVDPELSEENTLEITVIINEYVSEKLIKKFEKDFNNILAYSLYIAPGDDTLLLENDDVKCKCGSDKAQGKKIRCKMCETYQHLSCVGLGSEKDCKKYVCPHCLDKEEPIESSATLIIIPPTLTQQWKTEIKKHAKGCKLKIHLYEGVTKNYVLPHVLATYDIVIASFETLRAELNYVSEAINVRSFRQPKRYYSFPSPLTSVHWWRMCIDEAQMVENANKVSEMVSHIKAVHRWAVTGTPVGKSLRDLYGLVTYLNITPFTESFDHFEKLMYGEQTNLHKLFAYIMRRMTKNEVALQLNIPELKIETNLISFTPIEGYFYQYTHSVTEKTFMQKINQIKNLNQRLNEAYRYQAESVLKPLLALRQACVHPQAVNKKHMINLSKTVTMEELLEQMIKKTRTDCEDTLRIYIMNVNGAAGVKIIMDQYADAVLIFRGVLSKIEELVDLTADDFQILHAKHNLYETALKDTSIILTPQEQKIPEQVNDLEKKYIEKRQETVSVLLKTIERHLLEINDHLAETRLSCFDWWARLFRDSPFEELVSRIKTELEKVNIDVKDVKFLLLSYHRLQNALKTWLVEIEDKRNLIYTYLHHITEAMSMEKLCQSAKDCHLRQSTDSEKTCLLCTMEKTMRAYENILFNKNNKPKKNNRRKADERSSNDAISPANPLNWNMSAYECCLSGILAYGRLMYVMNDDVTKATNQLKALGLLKREFKTIRAAWTKQCEVVQGYDEVAMAKSRFDAVSGSMDKLENENPLFKNQSDNYGTYCQNQFDVYDAESVATFSKLQSQIGSLHYLMNLRTRCSTEEVNECCPVCHVSVDERRGVMPCGHFTCYQCMLTMVKNSSKILCPFCRATVLASNITYVYGGGAWNANLDDVRGNYSVKVLNVISKVLRLREENPEVKVLVFSTWDRVLELMEQAFKENQILYQRFVNTKNKRSSLVTFKEDPKVTVLLMPLQSGSKGLNITEASHIIFTEPVLHVADEKQAIGRIYRLGQTRKMTVHKFIVRSSIEEHLLEMNEFLQQNNAMGSELTFRHLKELFIATSNTCSEDNNDMM